MDKEKMSRGPDMTTVINQLDPDVSHLTGYPDSAVAIVGAACRFAGADSLEQLWEILETGTSQCTDIPKDRFPDSCFERRRYKKNFRANVMDNIGTFDHKFFNVSSREASFRDPQQRLALEVTYQALESAGYFSRERSEEQCDMGCYVATSMNEYHDNVATYAPSAFSLTGSLRPFIAGQVSHHFGFTGPAIMLDAACAASGVAINIACRAVASGECKGAIVGATNLFISPTTFQDLACGHFTSPTGSSKSFDAAADGYGRGEGVAVIVLKRLFDALKDGDVIKGVISATAVNQCANECAITVPHGPSQSSLYRKALQLARLDANQIGYVEAHGTGTRVGDPIEVESIRAVYGNLNRNSKEKIYMGSLKSNIGHTEASAGLSGLIKVMLMIEKGVIPQQALFTSLHPKISPLEPFGLQIPTKSIPWTSKFRAGCVNNYGASGSNAVMILTQPPNPVRTDRTTQISTWPISITAFSQTSLKSYCSALTEFVDRLSANGCLALDVSFHMSRRLNLEFPFSVCSTISNLRELKELLISAQSETATKLEYSRRPTVLFFGGQDGKTVSVSRTLYHSCDIFRKHLNNCDASLQALGFQSMFPTLFEPDDADESSLAHSKLFSVQYASASAWIDCGLRPSRLIGHSFGQITALCVSGALPLRDALRLVTSRARLIDEMWGSDAGSMIAIEATQSELSELLEQHRDLDLETACYNGAHSFVLAGTTSSVNSMEAFLESSPEPLHFKRLLVPHAFHSALAEHLVEPLHNISKELNLQEPRIPLEACSERNTWPSIDPFLIASQIREPVYFHQAVQRIAEQLGPCVWIEAGSGSNTSLLRRALEPQASRHDIKSVKLDSPSSLDSLAEMTADLWRLQLKVQFWPFHQDQRHQYQILNLPPYQFDRTRHWLDWQELDVPTVVPAPLLPKPTPFIRLVRETKDGCTLEINTQCERWQTKCVENRILGVSTCPVSLLLETLSEALGAVQGTSAQRASIYRVQHLDMQLPMPAAMDDSLILDVGRTDSPQPWTFRFYKASSSQQPFVSGAVWTGETRIQRDFIRFERLVDIARTRDLENDAKSDCIRGRAVYKILADFLQIPKHSQVIREVSIKGNEAAASLILSSENLRTAMENLIQIPLLCLNSMRECPDGHLFINVVIGDAHLRVTPTSPTATEALHSVYVKFFELAGLEPTCDMYVFDAKSGRITAVLVDVGFAQVPTKSLRQALEGDATSLSRLATSREVDSSDVPAPKGESMPLIQNLEPSLCDHESRQTDGLLDLTQALFELLARIADLNSDRVHGKSLITDLGIDSLMWMEVADEINRSFAVDIDLAELMVAEDVEALCQLVADRTTGFSYSPGTSSCAGSVSLSSLNASSDTSTSLSYTGTSKNHVERKTDSLASASSVLHAAFRAFDDIRAEFDVLASETGCARFWTEVHPVQTRLIEAYVVEAFAKLGCNLVSLQAGEQIPNVPHKQGRDKLLKQLMLVLCDGGLIEQAANGWLRTSKTIQVQSSSKLFNEIQLQFPKWAPEHELLHVAGSNLAGHFDGTQDPLKLLFGSPEKRKLMADQYRIAPIQSAVSRQLASFIEKCFSSQKLCRPLQILEVGGGTCGTTVWALDAFVKAGIPVEYTFTDISPSFISAARSRLKGYNFVKYRTLDVSEAPSAEFRGQYDMIIATNVIHATRDAGKSARNVRQMLRQDGFFTMVEYTCMYAAGDLIFGQLDGWWLFDDGRTHAIMNEHQWGSTLKNAGYNKVDWTGSGTRESEIARIFLAC